jgi:hypothetical protein
MKDVNDMQTYSMSWDSKKRINWLSVSFDMHELQDCYRQSVIYAFASDSERELVTQKGIKT